MIIIRVTMLLLTFFLLTLLSVLADANRTTQGPNSTDSQKQSDSENSTFTNTTQTVKESASDKDLTTIITTEAITTEGPTVEPTTVGTCETNDTNECIGVNATAVSLGKNDTETNKTAQEENKEQLRPEIETDTNICTCNLQVDFCDINCCCDPDCSTSDKTIFGYCQIDENRFYDTRYCNYIKYIYVNNTPAKWEVNQAGLFCVISSNVPDTYLIQKENPIHSIEVLPKKTFWRQEQDNMWETEPEFGFKNYRYGDSIWIVRDNSSIDNFRLPKNVLTSPCIYDEDVYYIKDVCNGCNQIDIDENNVKLNFSSFFEKFKIIGSPKLVNVTKLKNIFKNCPKNICIEIEPKLCNVHFTNCSRVTGNSNISFQCSYDVKKNLKTCQNAVEKIQYRFYHNGTDGIKKVQVLGVLSNVSYHFGREDFKIFQDFSAEFMWIDQIKNYSQIMSGNPGYLIGKPLLVGVRVIYGGAITVVERNSTALLDNVVVFPANVNGICVRNATCNTPIEFGYNMITKCDLQEKLTLDRKRNATEICRSIQENILDLWGLKTDLNRNRSLVVGLFGNANASSIKDWTSILYKTEPKTFLNSIQGNFTDKKNTTLECLNVSAVLEVDVFYSRVDLNTILNQNKVLGAGVGFKHVRNYNFSLDRKNNKLDLSLRLVGRVSFYDITRHKMRKYVDPPSFDIRLPYDFFYPFIRVGNDVGLVRPDTATVALFFCSFFLFY